MKNFTRYLRIEMFKSVKIKMLFSPHLFLYFRNFDLQNNAINTIKKSKIGFFNKMKISSGLLSLSFIMLSVGENQAQVANYSYTATTSTWAANSSPTSISGLGAGINDALSSAINIGFNFIYDGTTYTQFKASSNGFLTFNTANTLAQPTNNLNTSTDRTILAVLWDDNQTGA